MLCAQCIPVPSFQRESPNAVAPPWPVVADIWYSQRVADVKDDVPKWCVRAGLRCDFPMLTDAATTVRVWPCSTV